MSSTSLSWFRRLLRRNEYDVPQPPSRPLKRKWDGRWHPDTAASSTAPPMIIDQDNDGAAAAASPSRTSDDIMGHLRSSMAGMAVKASAAEKAGDAEAKEQREWAQKSSDETLRREAARVLVRNRDGAEALLRARAGELAEKQRAKQRASRAGVRSTAVAPSHIFAAPRVHAAAYPREMSAAAHALEIRRQALRVDESRLQREREAQHEARRLMQRKARTARSSTPARAVQLASSSRSRPRRVAAAAVATATASAAATTTTTTTAIDVRAPARRSESRVASSGLLPHEQSSWTAHLERAARAKLIRSIEDAAAVAAAATAAAFREASWAQSVADEAEAAAPSESSEEEEESVRTAVRSFLLSAEDSERVDDALVRHGNPSEVLVSGFKVDLTRDNLSCCAPNTWLKDEVVNFYFQLLNERNKRLRAEDPGCGVPDAHFHNSFFIIKLRDHGRGYVYKNVRKWTMRKRKVDLFSKDLIVVPININDMHWTLCVVFVGMKLIQYYDSMSGNGSAYTSALLRYLEDEWKDKAERYPATRNGGAAFNTKEWTLASGGGTVDGCAVPQQRNGSDCGVFMSAFASQIALARAPPFTTRGWAGAPPAPGSNFDFQQAQMPYFRRHMAASILNAHLGDFD